MAHRVGAARAINEGERLHLHLDGELNSHLGSPTALCIQSGCWALSRRLALGAGRYVTVYKLGQGKYHCLDSTCYHAGVPQRWLQACKHPG